MPNQLRHETSPYLLQHADNPVEWHPWGEPALRRARELDRPILLSVGYSACHWCHVMERESFENEAIAAQMNADFVCIKVDREERPDLDRIYQTAHQMLTQQPGGWPLTVALTPEGHAPFFTGTYFPPQRRGGMTGFGEVLTRVAAHYREQRQRMDGHVDTFREAMARLNPHAPEAPPPPAATLAQGAAELARQFDGEFGGLGRAPKFPHPTQLELLLHHGLSGTEGAAHSRHMVDKSLHHMACGGLFDHLGGGFYRYSVDRQWRIPHFEKMLYDNAQLLALYADAAHHSAHGETWRAVVEHTAAWVMTDMQQNHGGYASTLDADSLSGEESEEGAYYVWSEQQLRAALSDAEYTALAAWYDLGAAPNFEGRWHLGRITPPDGAPPEILGRAHARLLAVRSERVRPHLDDKILTAWNGLMIKGLARAVRAFGGEQWVRSAQRSLDFLRTTMWRGGRLHVTWRGGEGRLNGYLDDYAFLAEGIVELLQVAWRSDDLAFAVALCDAMRCAFEDTAGGGFYFTAADHEPLLHRPKAGPDDAIPSGNGAAARVLCKLGYLLGNTDYLESAENTLRAFATGLATAPSVHASLALALPAFGATAPMVIIRGADEEMLRWRMACQRRHPAVSVFAIPPDAADLPPALAARTPRAATTAYLCRGHQCSAPLDSLQSLAAALAEDGG